MSLVVVYSLSRIWLLWPHRLQTARILCPWYFPGKNTGVGCPALFQRIFPIHGSNPGLSHCRADSVPTEIWGKPMYAYTCKYMQAQSFQSCLTPGDLPSQLSHEESPCMLIHVYICKLSHFSHLWLFMTLWTVACQSPLSMEFPSQEYWSGLSCPPPGIFPIQGSNPGLPHCRADSLPLSHLDSPMYIYLYNVYLCMFMYK